MEKPLLVGRLLRVVAGITLLVSLAFLPGALGTLQLVVIFLGVSFLVGGIRANPGCEITALPNLFLRRPLHCW